MILIVLIIAMAGLKYFEVSYMESISWWWIIGLFFVTFVWFEFFERALGLDKKKAHKKFDEIQKTRAKRAFEKKK